ncbi:hypothetical protein VNO78_08169 [Psophocarpus tetragonolobus]|uniref:Uncharacterized protein n=1 Tax=Psophocarpus tetragonolobus TaxID=3891 RepID=A0AAN9T4R1_PSOTE
MVSLALVPPKVQWCRQGREPLAYFSKWFCLTPALADQVFDKIVWDIQNLEFREAINGIRKVLKLVGVNVQHHHVQQSRC